jgi:uncharacterized protein (TIGR02588 family)
VTSAKKSSKAGMSRERTAFEWVLLGVSVAAILAIAGGLIFYSLSFETGPADLHATIAPDPAEPHTFILTVENRGGTTAEDVIVVVRRGSATDEVEFRAIAKGDSEEATVQMGGSDAPVVRVANYKES